MQVFGVEFSNGLEKLVQELNGSEVIVLQDLFYFGKLDERDIWFVVQVFIISRELVGIFEF